MNIVILILGSIVSWLVIGVFVFWLVCFIDEHFYDSYADDFYVIVLWPLTFLIFVTPEIFSIIKNTPRKLLKPAIKVGERITRKRWGA